MRRRRSRSSGAVLAEPHRPTMTDRIKDHARMAAHSLAEEHPDVKRVRDSIERHMGSAMRGAVRKMKRSR